MRNFLDYTSYLLMGLSVGSFIAAMWLAFSLGMEEPLILFLAFLLVAKILGGIFTSIQSALKAAEQAEQMKEWVEKIKKGGK